MESRPDQETRLTQYSRGAGCGCKIAPAALEEILSGGRNADLFPSLLVGNNTKDDAAVFDTGQEEAVISTVDFFMPIVDDAFDFGRIAAANAISDVYAMGGRPIMAVAILGWPIEKLPAGLAARVLDGAKMICQEANIPLAGGHTVDSAEPIFGLSVTGLVRKQHLKKNSGARPGDLLFLTKPIGSGILSTAQKRDVIVPEHLDCLVKNMVRLNRVGEVLGAVAGVTAMTDVTGFGLAGHLIEMMEAAGTSAALDYGTIPVMEGVPEYLSARIVPDATYRNWNSYGTKVSFEKGVNVMEAFSLLPDPQTNGGLLISVSPEAEGLVSSMLEEAGLHYKPVGQVTEKTEKAIIVRP